MSLTCIACLYTKKASASHDDALDEITAYSSAYFYLGDEIDGYSPDNDSWDLWDYLLYSGIAITEDKPEQQWIVVDWSDNRKDVLVNGVYIHTDET